MEIAADRLPADALGPRIAAGRDMVVYALGSDRVARQAEDERSLVVEAEAMQHARQAGFPVPQVHRIAPGQMVLERIDGPTMLADLTRHPWRIDAHARLLGELHEQLHAIQAPASVRSLDVPGSALLHLDLHPGNVLLSPDGPVVIDWTNVASGPAAADVALTWIILAAFEADGSVVTRGLVALLRKRLTQTFLATTGVEAARAVLPAVAEYRMRDRNARPSEREAIRRLVERETT